MFSNREKVLGGEQRMRSTYTQSINHDIELFFWHLSFKQLCLTVLADN
jgi:hypothetical protein